MSVIRRIATVILVLLVSWMVTRIVDDKRLPFASQIGFTVVWLVMVVGFAFRKALIPEINNYSAEKQDVFTFFGWFFLVIFEGGAIAIWQFADPS